MIRSNSNCGRIGRVCVTYDPAQQNPAILNDQTNAIEFVRAGVSVRQEGKTSKTKSGLQVIRLKKMKS